MIKLGNLSRLEVEELRLYLVRDFPGRQLGHELGRPYVSHPEVHDQLVVALAAHGKDIVFDEIVSIRKRRAERRPRRRNTQLTPKQILSSDTEKLTWLFSVWSKYPAIGGEPGTVPPKTKAVLENIAIELTRRSVPLPCAMPRTEGAAPVKRRTRKHTRDTPERKRTDASALSQVIEGLGVVIEAVGRRIGNGTIVAGAVQVMAATAREAT